MAEGARPTGNQENQHSSLIGQKLNLVIRTLVL